MPARPESGALGARAARAHGEPHMQMQTRRGGSTRSIASRGTAPWRRKDPARARPFRRPCAPPVGRRDPALISAGMKRVPAISPARPTARTHSRTHAGPTHARTKRRYAGKPARPLTASHSASRFRMASNSSIVRAQCGPNGQRLYLMVRGHLVKRRNGIGNRRSSRPKNWREREREVCPECDTG